MIESLKNSTKKNRQHFPPKISFGNIDIIKITMLKKSLEIFFINKGYYVIQIQITNGNPELQTILNKNYLKRQHFIKNVCSGNNNLIIFYKNIILTFFQQNMFISKEELYNW